MEEDQAPGCKAASPPFGPTTPAGMPGLSSLDSSSAGNPVGQHFLLSNPPVSGTQATC